MNRKYIFITFSIVEVGGSQIYVDKKKSALESCGWEVYVFSANQGHIIIDGLRDCEKYIDFRYGAPPVSFSKKTRHRIVNNLIDTIGMAEEMIIESHSGIMGMWGELLAEKLHATHLLYSIEEKCTSLNASHLKFLQFKWEQKALAGITPTVLKHFFESQGIIIKEEQSYCLRAYGNSSLEDVPTAIQMPSGLETIGLMGRLEKAFMYPTALSIAEYINNRQDRRFNVLVVGGGSKADINKIQSCFKGLTNCNLIMTGHLFPVPDALVSQVSVMVSSSGSCSLSRRVGVPTISIDGNDLKPIGVLGYTTNQILFRKEERPVELADLLDDILEEKIYKKEIKPFEPLKPDYTSHKQFVDGINMNMGSYDIDTITIPSTYIIKMRLKRMLRRLVGYKRYEQLSKMKVNV